MSTELTVTLTEDLIGASSSCTLKINGAVKSTGSATAVWPDETEQMEAQRARILQELAHRAVGEAFSGLN